MNFEINLRKRKKYYKKQRKGMMYYLKYIG